MVLANIFLSTWHYIHVLAWTVLCIPGSSLQNEFPICDQQLNIHIVFEPLIKNYVPQLLIVLYIYTHSWRIFEPPLFSDILQPSVQPDLR